MNMMTFIIAFVLAIIFSAILFFVIMPRYFLGSGKTGGIAGFKKREKLIQLASIVCFLSSLAYLLTAFFLFFSDASVPSTLSVFGMLMHSAFFIAKWIPLVVACFLQIVLVVSVIAIVFLSRDMSRGTVQTKKRQRVFELNEEARAELEQQDD